MTEILTNNCKNGSLQKKVCQSMKLIESLYTGSEILAFSGGKDSIVLYDLVKRVVGNDIPIIHAVTTRDPAGTLSFIRNNYPDVVLDMPDTTFGELVRKKGFPSRMRRFCCEVLKERVGIGKRVFGGMRQSESVKRSVYEPEMCDERGFMKGTKHLLPIVSWTDDDVAEFIAERGIKCHPLYYDEHGNFHVERRLGCIGCPMKSDRGKADFRKYPRFLKRLIAVTQEYLDTHPHVMSVEKFGNAYNLVFQNLFCKSYEQFANLIGGACSPKPPLTRKPF